MMILIYYSINIDLSYVADSEIQLSYLTANKKYSHSRKKQERIENNIIQMNCLRNVLPTSTSKNLEETFPTVSQIQFFVNPKWMIW